MAELQKGHTYYRCHTPKCGTKTIREERFYAALADAFKPLQLSKAEITCAQRWFVRSRLNQGEHQKEEIERYQLNLAQLRDRLMRLTDAYLDGVLDKSLLEERRNVLLMEEAGMKQKIADLEAGCSDTLIRVEKFLELVKSASNLDNLAIPEEKRVLAKKLTSNLGIGPKNVAITLNAEAQEIANRSQLLCSSPNRGVPRTWDTLLTRLVNMFNEKQAA
jgi:dsDNA-specific endonuclease/ATPase MutS2